MSTVQLSDIIDVTVFQDLPAVNSPEKTAFAESGIITSSPLLNSLATAAGSIAELPFWNDIDPTVEVNYSTDDPADVAVPNKVSQGSQVTRKAYVNNGWSTSNLASELAMGTDAMTHIRSKVDRYFTRQWQRRLIASTSGVLAGNVANNGGDMVIDVAAESTGAQTVDTKFSRSNFTAAAFTLGDMFDMTGAIAVHHMVYKQMVDQDDIEFLQDANGRMTIPTYMGKRVIVDDSMPVIAGSTSGFKYVTTLFGDGAFGYGNGSPVKPVALESEEAQGNGAGIETLWVRNTWIIHPFGYKIQGTPSGTGFTLAELNDASRFERVVERKNVPLAFLITN